MKKKLSTFLSLILVLSVMIPNLTVSAAGINVKINSNSITFNDNSGVPFVDAANRTQVPLRAAMEAYGCQVNWNSSTQIAMIQKDGKIVEVPIGQPYIIVDGITKPTDTAAVIRYNRTYLPIRPVLESFGATVAWEQSSQTVNVYTPGYTPPATTQKPATTTRPTTTAPTTTSAKYVGNSRTKLVHASTCSKVQYINPYNRVEFSSCSQAVSQGYERCYYCNPR